MKQVGKIESYLPQPRCLFLPMGTTKNMLQLRFVPHMLELVSNRRYPKVEPFILKGRFSALSGVIRGCNEEYASNTPLGYYFLANMTLSYLGTEKVLAFHSGAERFKRYLPDSWLLGMLGMPSSSYPRCRAQQFYW